MEEDIYIIDADAPSPAASPRDTAAAQARIDAIRKDPKHPYHSMRDGAAHQAAVAEMTRLYEQL